MNFKNFETLAISNKLAKTAQNEHSSPIFLTASYAFDSSQHAAELFSETQSGNIYSRFTNPNLDEFILKLKTLEKCESGVATATGMAAVYTSLVPFLKTGDHIVASKSIFGNSVKIIKKFLADFGVEHTFVDIDKNELWEKAIKPNTKILFVETPANPTLKIADLEFLGNLSKKNNLIFVVDNCMATPYLQNPVDFGADLIVHSATKFIDGQGRALGGAILGKKELVEKAETFIRNTGATLSPFNAWIFSKSIETLALRLDRQSENAQKLCNFLKNHPEVEKVFYPFDNDFPQKELAQKQMKKGGAIVGCEIKGGVKRGAKFIDALKLFSITANFGDVKSIATHPASTTHSSLSETERKDAEISDGFIRFSVGIEHIDDLTADINNALLVS